MIRISSAATTEKGTTTGKAVMAKGIRADTAARRNTGAPETADATKRNARKNTRINTRKMI